MFNIRIYWKDENKKILKQQSKFTFSGIHKSYENCVRYLFKHNEVKMDLLIYLGFAKLELIKLHMYNHIMINYNIILNKKIYITIYRYWCFRFEWEYKQYYQGLKNSGRFNWFRQLR